MYYMVDWLMFFKGDDYLTLIHLFKYLTCSVLVTQNKDPRNLGTENGLPESNVVKQFVFVCLFTYLLTYLFFIYLFIYRQFYSTRESARYKMPGWFVSVGQVGVNESPPSTTPCTRSRVAHVRPPR